MRTSLFCLLALVVLIPNVIAGQDTLPSWVPKDALSAAKKQWDNRAMDFGAASLQQTYGLNDTNEVLSCELKHPYRVIEIDYPNCSDGNILNCLVSPHGLWDSAYGFGIYYNGALIGDIVVTYRNGSWRMASISGRGQERREDNLAPIFDRYPASAGYKIYKDWNGAFFVLKQDSVIAAFVFDTQGIKYRETKPQEYIQTERARRIEWGKKYYQRFHQ